MKNIVLTAAGQELRFQPELSAYNKYINEMMPNDKVAPSTNYLRRIVHKDDKAKLDEVLKLPGAVLRLIAKVNEIFEGDLDIEVKNS
ncbi:putative phage tail assembly chaperone [Vibrio sp. Of7-15]|uniref:putative phage tail assembly chaperone n=1 Tax=Vibrio sp. Of7-15 TaxID=2724879 RepID=UPI001EF20BD8|nr:putative phage tail assembly chaperone [Vibrio sp. Of7-15]MCG7497754.1 putative phage tail assembly chaperone [Vibrio sp. Of7-15]